MHAVLQIAAALYIIYSVLRIHDRPGLFGGVLLNTYVYSIYFGSIGPLAGALALGVGVARWREGGALRKSEIWLFAWIALSLSTIVGSSHVEIAAEYGAYLVFLALGTYAYARATCSQGEGYLTDVFVSCCIALVLCEPTIFTTRSLAFTRLTGNLSPVGASTLVDVPLMGSIAYLMIDEKLRGWLRFGILCFLVLIVIPVALSYGTRGVFLAAGVGTLSPLVSRLGRGRWGSLLADLSKALLLLGVAGAVAWLYLLRTSPAIVRAIGRIGANAAASGGVTLDESSLERLRLFGEAQSLIAASPIFGYSIGAFSYLADYANDSYPHNVILEILVNTGFVGLALFVAATIPVFVIAIKQVIKAPQDTLTSISLSLLVYSFARLQVSETITQGKLFFFMLALTMIFSDKARLSPVTARGWVPAAGLR